MDTPVESTVDDTGMSPEQSRYKVEPACALVDDSCGPARAETCGRTMDNDKPVAHTPGLIAHRVHRLNNGYILKSENSVLTKGSILTCAGNLS